MTKFQSSNLTVPAKILAVFTCALLTGFMWRVRGESGWGSMWGMFTVGVILILFVFSVFGDRKKMSIEAIPIGVFLLGITNGGWGTLNSQMSGTLTSTAEFTGETTARLYEINPVCGLFMMLVLGFSWMPLFALFIGYMFSDKKYKISQFVLLIAVFYAVTYICKFSVSHLILEAVHPESVSFFKEGLSDRNLDLTPFSAYLQNFGSAAWAKKIPFGRNYFTSIDVVSAALGALFSSLCALVVFKDKITGCASLAINTVSAVSITLADIVMIAGKETGLLPNLKLPEFFTQSAWSIWEYFTGFLLGLGIMLVLVLLPKNTIKEEPFENVVPFKNRKIYYVYTSFLTLAFAFCVTLLRPLGFRIADTLFKEGKISDEDTVGTILAVIFTVIAAIICFVTSKHIVKEEKTAFSLNTKMFSRKAVNIYFVLTAAVYFIFEYKIIFEKFTSFERFKTSLADGTAAVMFIMFLTFAVTPVFLLLTYSIEKKNSKTEI